MRVGVCALVVFAGCGGSRGTNPAPHAPDLATPYVAPAVDMAIVASDGGDGGNHDGGDGGSGVVNGTATISGAFNGYDVPTVRSVVSVVNGQSFEVYISDRVDLCTIMQMGSSPKNTSIFRIGSTAGMTGHTFPAGMYTFPSGGNGGGMGGGGGMGTTNAVIMRSGASCIFDGYDQASAGSFTIGAAVAPTATEIDGSFDITFTVGAQMATFNGTFKAPVCPNATNVPQTPVYCE